MEGMDLLDHEDPRWGKLVQAVNHWLEKHDFASFDICLCHTDPKEKVTRTARLTYGRIVGTTEKIATEQAIANALKAAAPEGKVYVWP